MPSETGYILFKMERPCSSFMVGSSSKQMGDWQLGLPRLMFTVVQSSGLTNWYGVIPALFPNVKYIYGIMTGSMLLYLSKLKHYAAELPLLSADYYGSSEGWIGANVNPNLPPESATFAVLPNLGYYEFIPLKETSDSGLLLSERRPVGIAEVNVGEEYEIVYTNFAGLYRYKIGDVVRVTGFHNATPKFQFVCRSNLVLNIHLDKNTEKDLVASVGAAEKLEVLDFASLGDLFINISWSLCHLLGNKQTMRS